MRTVISKKDIAQIRGGTTPMALQAAGSAVPQQPDDYKERLLKYIPAEVIAVYLTLDTLVRQTAKDHMPLYWFIFAFGLIATPLTLWRMQHIKKKLQLLISTGAFIVWVFAIGGPFSHLTFYDSLYAGVLLIMYTFCIPLIEA